MLSEDFHVRDFIEDDVFSCSEEEVEEDVLEDYDFDSEEDMSDYYDAHTCCDNGYGVCSECGAVISGSFADHDLFWY